MEQKRNKSAQNFLVQGSILAITSMIARLIGIAYRIPITNTIGDVGNGYYSTAYNIYALLLIISSNSLPLAVSKLVSARVHAGQKRNAMKLLKGALVFAVVSGGLATLITFFGADFYCTHISKSPMSAYALKVLAPTLLIVALLGTLRGFFQGIGTMVPTSISQIIEQIFNAIVSVTAAIMLFSYGTKIDAIYGDSNYAEAYGAAGSTLGTCMGALSGLIFVAVLFIIYKRRKFNRQMAKDVTSDIETNDEIFKALFFTIIPVILSSTIYNIGSILNQIVFSNILTYKNLAEDSIAALYGIYSSKYILITNLPISIATALGASLVPSLTASMVEGRKDIAKEKISSIIRFSMLIAIPSAVGLFVIGEPLMQILFSQESQVAGNVMRLGAITVIFYSLSTITNAILQGISKLKIPVIHAGISVVVQIIVLASMLLATKAGVYAIVCADMAFSLLMCILNSMSIGKYMNYKQEKYKTFILPTVCALIMGACTYLVYRVIYMGLNNVLISTAVAVVVAVIVYAVTMILFRGITEEELESFPMGGKIAKIAKKLHLMRI